MWNKQVKEKEDLLKVLLKVTSVLIVIDQVIGLMNAENQKKILETEMETDIETEIEENQEDLEDQGKAIEVMKDVVSKLSGTRHAGNATHRLRELDSS